MHDCPLPLVIDPPGWTSVTLPAELKQVGPIVKNLRDWLQLHGAKDGTALEGVTLAVHEALTNAIRHGESRGPAGRVRLAWVWRDTDLEVEVSEPGTFTPSPAWGKLPEDPLAESGRGGFLIRQFMDAVEHRNADGRHALHMRKRLERTPTDQTRPTP